MSRSAIEKAMRRNNIPAAPLYGTDGWWIKRGDQAAQEKGDVRFAATDTERDAAIREFHERGVEDIVVTAHVRGDLVKFYGVRGSGFFYCCYPTDGTYSKFGDEKLNGMARHTPFSQQSLNADAERLAGITGIDIYGGDCIVRSDGSYAIIDFNDFPSFAVCRRVIPKRQMKLADIEQNIRFVGMGDTIEIWRSNGEEEAFMDSEEFSKALQEIMSSNNTVKE